MAEQKNSGQEIGFQPLKLPTNRLPINGDVIRAISFEKSENNRTYNDAINIIVRDIISLWKKTSLPTVNVKTVKDKVNSYHQKYLKTITGNSSRSAYIRKFQQFQVNKVPIIHTFKNSNLAIF